MSQDIYVSCPHCHRKNRLPADKLSAHGNCGACKQALFTGAPIPVTQNQFEQHLGGSLPVVVDFWAPWCGPCRQFAPTFEAACRTLEPRAQLLKVNTEEQTGLAQRYGIRSIPTLMIFRDGKEVARVSGALPASQFTAWVQQHL
ncbi:MAG: thioredoxin TrxC [Pseudomonadales bacterium]|nr:thioredoxin TrxC [Pseudomonadales bacterium]MCP5330683.1 thioredoxin TrxC [Pseudomonadales bacterium]MCP5344930.1 thioredoxin TrxC [Pseudomonadales bacterium]